MCKPEGDLWDMMKKSFLRYQKAWHPHHWPKVGDIRRLMNRWPDATYVAVSRAGANWLDDLALQAKYPRRKPLAVLEGDVESLADNYDQTTRKLKAKRHLQRREVPIHKGMYIYLTRNVHKDKDYVNGMRCTVQDYDATNQAVIAITETDKVITV
eukprot:2489631-Karenia_brevis.AAC.1